MYTIVNIIYGIPLTEKITKKINEWEEDENSPWFEDKNGTCGFNMLYTGSSDYAGYAGVLLEELTPCVDFIKFNDLKIKPTTQQIKEAKEELKKVPEELRKLAPELDIYIVFSTS